MVGNDNEKSITFKLPIIPHDMEMSLDKGDHVETVVLMSMAGVTGRYPKDEIFQ